jgi:hypothetical protein
VKYYINRYAIYKCSYPSEWKEYYFQYAIDDSKIAFVGLNNDNTYYVYIITNDIYQVGNERFKTLCDAQTYLHSELTKQGYILLSKEMEMLL